jgi:phosphoglycolate phosphatase
MNKQVNIEAVIFDLDGTLLDTIEDIGDAANAMFEQYGLPLHSISASQNWAGTGVLKPIARALQDDYDPAQAQPYVATFREIYSNNLNRKTRLYEGFPELLTELAKRAIRLSVLSNKPDYLTKKIARFYLNLWPFHPVLGQRDHVPRKPDPAAALEIAETLDIEPGRIMFVGDSDTDMNTARAAGMVPVGVTWGYGRMGDHSFEKEGACIDYPGELMSLII